MKESHIHISFQSSCAYSQRMAAVLQLQDQSKAGSQQTKEFLMDKWGISMGLSKLTLSPHRLDEHETFLHKEGFNLLCLFFFFVCQIIHSFFCGRFFSFFIKSVTHNLQEELEGIYCYLLWRALAFSQGFVLSFEHNKRFSRCL